MPKNTTLAGRSKTAAADTKSAKAVFALAVLVLAIAAALLLPPLAHAQPAGGPPSQDSEEKTGWSMQVGGAVLVSPHYRGDEDYRVLPVPFLSASYGERLTVSFPRGLRYDIDNEGAFQFGAGLNIEPGREEADAGILQGLGDVGLAVGPQAYASYKVGPVKLSAEAFTDVADGHGGSHIDIGASMPVYFSRKWGIVRASVTAEFGDDAYVSSLFGIDADQASTSLSNLPEYDTGAGLTELSVSLNHIKPFEGDWTLVTIVSAGQLQGDAADSPIVLSETQIFALTAFTRSF